MTRKTMALIAVLAAIAAAVAGWYVQRTFASMVTTTEIVTPAVRVPAGALIRSDMLATKIAPRPLLDEDIYVHAEELAGRVAVTPLQPGMVIYRSFAVPAEEYRLTDDPTAEVISFPVDPAKAVGGQLQPGNHVDIWRLLAARSPATDDIGELAAGIYATATLLAENVPVVDVRAGSGQPYARQPQAVPGDVTQNQQQSTSGLALQILTVAVPRDAAQVILSLVAEQRAGMDLWVTLAPLTTEEGVRVNRSTVANQGVDAASLTPPVILSVERQDDGVVIRWQGTGEPVDSYVLYRSDDGEGSWQKVHRVAAVGDNRGEYKVILENDDTGYFGIVAVASDGRESPMVWMQREG